MSAKVSPEMLQKLMEAKLDEAMLLKLRDKYGPAMFLRLSNDRQLQPESITLLERVNAAGDVFLSGTALNGRFTLRLAVGNLGTTREHVERAWDWIRQEGP